MTKREKKRNWWRERIEEQQQSDSSMAQYCRSHGIVYNNLMRWRSVFAEEENPVRSVPSEDGDFQELMLVPQELELTCGSCRLKIPADLEGDQLTRIIVAMNQAAGLLC